MGFLFCEDGNGAAAAAAAAATAAEQAIHCKKCYVEFTNFWSK